MFDLDNAIADWRRQMLAAGIKSPVPLDELESHLRDDIAEQVRAGVGAQKAFAAAVQRVGHPGPLKTEFEKAGEAKRARELKLMRAIMVGTAGFYALFVGVCVFFRLGSFSDINLREQMSAALATLLTILPLINGRFVHRFFPVIPARRTRIGIYAAGVALLFAWLSIFYHLVMTRFEFNVGPLVVALLWAWMVPFGTLCGVIFGLERAALQKFDHGHPV